MSATATFHLLPVNTLDGVRSAAEPKKRFFGHAKDDYWGFVRLNGHTVAHYAWSGNVFLPLLGWLKDTRGIDFADGPYRELEKFLIEKRGSSLFLLTYEHKRKYLDLLDPSTVSIEELRDAYNAFEGTNEPDAGAPMLDGIKALHEALSSVSQDTVVLFTIG